MAEIWLIEDNVSFRDAIERSLKAEVPDSVVRAFKCCEDALAGFSTEHPPSVILLDLGLPGMSGIEGIQEFKKRSEEVSILILTVYEDDDKIFRAICAGASGYLLKSDSIETIIPAIGQCAAGGAPMNPRVARRVLAMLSKQERGKGDYHLNERETEVLQLLVEGLSQKQLADRMGINPHTVNYLLRRIYKKLHVNCQVAAVALAVKEGLLSK